MTYMIICSNHSRFFTRFNNNSSPSTSPKSSHSLPNTTTTIATHSHAYIHKYVRARTYASTCTFTHRYAHRPYEHTEDGHTHLYCFFLSFYKIIQSEYFFILFYCFQMQCCKCFFFIFLQA